MLITELLAGLLQQLSDHKVAFGFLYLDFNEASALVIMQEPELIYLKEKKPLFYPVNKLYLS